jgi:YHS domain-containing protein
MTKNIFIFLSTFALGALIALVARAAFFNPHAAHATAAPPERGAYAPLVSNPLTPPKTADASPSAALGAAADPHAAHNASPATRAATESPPPPASAAVNTVCAICGMAVNPKLPTAEYQGKTIAFGCRMCPPKFKADPDKYGPAYLRNEVIKR